jgi:hypothetical protein
MNIHRGPIHPQASMRGPRVEQQMFSMPGSILSQIAAQQQAAQQHAQHQAAQQHAQQQALAQQQAAAAQQQQMINHRNAMIMNQSRMGGYATTPSGSASFPNSFLDMRGGDQRSQAAAFIRAREYPDRPVGFMGRVNMVDTRPHGIPARPSPPRPKRPSPSRPHAPTANTQPSGRPAVPARYGGIGGNAPPQTSGPAPRSTAAIRPVPSVGLAPQRPASNPTARDGALSRRRDGDSSDSDLEVLEGSRKRHRRSSQCRRWRFCPRAPAIHALHSI